MQEGKKSQGQTLEERVELLGNAKVMRFWCMSQQNVVGSYQHAMEFWRAGTQGSLADGEEVELTLSLLFNRFLFKVLNSFVV